jgi:phosphate-selective porin OprO/OprP
MKKTAIFTVKRISLAAALVCGVLTAPAFAQVETKVTGRVHYDFRSINNGLPGLNDRDTASVADNFELRRARIGLTGSINKDLQFEAVGNAVGGTTNFIDTAFINYGYNKQGQIRLGRFKQPFSLEENTSSNNIDFMERSYINQMVPGKKLGAMLHGSTSNGLTYSASAFQQDFNEITNANPAGTMGALRVTSNLAKLAQIGGDDTVLHLGYGAVRGKYEQTASSSTNTSKIAESTTRSTILAFRDENRGLSNAYRLQIGGSVLPETVYGGTANEVPVISQNLQGLELAVSNGPIKFQSEYARSTYNASSLLCNTYSSGNCTSYANANVTATVNASYIAMLWNITGENFSKTYSNSNGTWGSIKPSNEFMKDYGGVVGNGMGAWQLVYRYSTYDASVNQTTGTSGISRSITDGANSHSRYQNSPSAVTQTIGLNWLMSSNARVMFNYSDTRFGQSVEYLDTDSNSSTTTGEQIFSVRTQVNF